jgi:maltooligosyltrehalose trehalohydrolase
MRKGVGIPDKTRSVRLGAAHLGNGCEFCVWAPRATAVDLHIVEPRERVVHMEAVGRGYHRATVEGIGPGWRYFYRLDGGRDLPDPASRCQAGNVHGPSEVLSDHFRWTDGGWRGLPLEDYLAYETHIGTFTPEGTFEAAIRHLDELKQLGVTAFEVMPVAQFPGARNWGYDGVFPFAVQNTYGGALGLKRLVDACHARGLAAILDVVYNHLGPEGNYLCEFGPYFTSRHRTPWGDAVNFDGPGSDEVRRYFIENALQWIEEFHFDAIRVDAVHAIFDQSANPFLRQLASAVREAGRRLGRKAYTIGESDLNDIRLILPERENGHGFDALWDDDFHHAIHAQLTGERKGYYQDFGSVSAIGKAMQEAFVYTGEYSAFRGRSQGSATAAARASQFVVFAQNHDQVGNRMLGERLSALVCFEKLKLAAGLVLLSPYLPMLFMGEEYGETAPFLYFVDHSDPALIEVVRKGRREEFAGFGWAGEPPDPANEETFRRSKLNHALAGEGRHKILKEFYAELIRLRKSMPALSTPDKSRIETRACEERRLLWLRRWCRGEEALAVFHLGDAEAEAEAPAGCWRKMLDSADTRWGGGGGRVPGLLELQTGARLPLAADSFALFSRVDESASREA